MHSSQSSGEDDEKRAVQRQPAGWIWRDGKDESRADFRAGPLSACFPAESAVAGQPGWLFETFTEFEQELSLCFQPALQQIRYGKLRKGASGCFAEP